jgi:hypothetical protein
MEEEALNGRLLKAAADGDVAVATRALEDGANVNATDEDRNTPLHLAASYDVARLLVDRGADLNATNSIGPGRTPLELARYSGYFRIAEMLADVAKTRQKNLTR